MSLYNGPARGGNRGGKDQFNWDSVKNDKDREFYIGHSVKASVGRWQKGKDILWYTREKEAEEQAKAQQELLAVRQREEDLMAEALGIKPRQLRPAAAPRLDQAEMQQLLHGQAAGEGEEPLDAAQQADRMKGLGYMPNLSTGGGAAEQEVMAGVGVPQSAAAQQAALQQAQQQQQQLLPPPPQQRMLPAEQQALMRKARRKLEKQSKQEAKKAKKAKKKASKEKRRRADDKAGPSAKRQRHDASSDDGSSERGDTPANRRGLSPPRRKQRGHASAAGVGDAAPAASPGHREGASLSPPRRRQQHANWYSSGPVAGARVAEPSPSAPGLPEQQHPRDQGAAEAEGWRERGSRHAGHPHAERRHAERDGSRHERDSAAGGREVELPAEPSHQRPGRDRDSAHERRHRPSPPRRRPAAPSRDELPPSRRSSGREFTPPPRRRRHSRD